jgi:hypothetical protein
MRFITIISISVCVLTFATHSVSGLPIDFSKGINEDHQGLSENVETEGETGPEYTESEVEVDLNDIME